MTTKFTYWREADEKFLGYLNDFPDHWTQGDSLQDLKDHLRDLYETFSEETIPGIKKVEELVVWLLSLDCGICHACLHVGEGQHNQFLDTRRSTSYSPGRFSETSQKQNNANNRVQPTSLRSAADAGRGIRKKGFHGGRAARR